MKLTILYLFLGVSDLQFLAPPDAFTVQVNQRLHQNYKS